MKFNCASPEYLKVEYTGSTSSPELSNLAYVMTEKIKYVPVNIITNHLNIIFFIFLPMNGKKSNNTTKTSNNENTIVARDTAANIVLILVIA